ncbi:MAG: HAD hydrolase-like protein, partial [Thiohalomonadales bacterium]
MQAIIFDVDGTLADTEEAHRQAFNDTFRERGLAWHWSIQDYLSLLKVTGGKERIRHFIDTSQGRLPEPVADMDDYIAELHRAKTQRYQAIIEAGQLPLRTGVKRLLLEARRVGLKLAIATTTSHSNVQSLLEINLGADASGWFAVMGTGEDVSQKKPHPEVYEVV